MESKPASKKITKSRSMKTGGGSPAAVATGYVPLALSGVETKIAPLAKVLLVGLAGSIGKGIPAFTTPGARIAFWRSLRDYAGRNLTACETPAKTATAGA